MRGEHGIARSQLKGYLFEIIILYLLKQNGFSSINVMAEPNDRVRELREGFVELKGRGCWHQIDCPCEYSRLIPFSYPIRLLGEVKFYAKALDKKHIRAFIGVVRDIQENYFVAEGINRVDFYPRRLEIGVYFSANGFQDEAEKLAYAHGIKTISYSNNYLIDRIKRLITELEENYLSVQCMNSHNWGAFRREFSDAIQYGLIDNYPAHHYHYVANGYNEVISSLHEHLIEIHSSFIGTTVTGVFIHFVSENQFPLELFAGTDEGRCRVYYNYDNLRMRYFWLEISHDQQRRRFYFTPPESLDESAIYGGEIALGEKQRLFRALNISINLNGINRNLILHIDEDWLGAVRNRNME
mgnify:CR=1 FL=1